MDDRQRASDHNTPPEELRAIWASDKKSGTNQALASNPNTPVSILVALAPGYPAEFFSNPALPLLLLEQPHFFETWFSEFSLMGFLNRDDCHPGVFLAGIQSGKGLLLRRVARHPKASAEVLGETLAKAEATQQEDIELRMTLEAILNHPNAAQTTKDKARKLYQQQRER